MLTFIFLLEMNLSLYVSKIFIKAFFFFFDNHYEEGVRKSGLFSKVAEARKKLARDDATRARCTPAPAERRRLREAHDATNRDAKKLPAQSNAMRAQCWN